MPTSQASGSETLVVQSANMISNGDFASSSNWTTGSGWSISNTASASSSSASLSQAASPSLIQNDFYLVSFSVTSYTSGSVTPYVGGTAGTARSATGRYSEVIQAGSGADLAFTASSATLSIDDVVCVQIGQRLHSNTTAGTYQIHLDLAPLQNGDEVMAMVGSQIGSSGDMGWFQIGSYAHAQPMSNGKVSVPVVSLHQCEFTLVQLAGTARTIDWEVISL